MKKTKTKRLYIRHYNDIVNHSKTKFIPKIHVYHHFKNLRVAIFFLNHEIEIFFMDH